MFYTYDSAWNYSHFQAAGEEKQTGPKVERAIGRHKEKARGITYRVT